MTPGDWSMRDKATTLALIHALRALAKDLREKPWHQRPSQVADCIEALIDSHPGAHADGP